MTSPETPATPKARPAQVAAVCALAYTVLVGYALARPASESLFLARYGSAKLPWAWAAVAIGAVVIVGVYNHAAARRSLTWLLTRSIALSALSLALIGAASRLGVPHAGFALYVWKDVHIVVLIEGLWSFANIVFDKRSARWLYGLFCAAGSLGGITGNLAVGWIAAHFSTEAALVVLLPLFGLQALAARALGRVSGDPRPKTKEGDPGRSLGEDWALLRGSRALPLMVLLIGTVQIVTTLVDYQFNVAVEQAFPDTDARTDAIGRLYATIDASSLALQLGTGVVLRTLGLRGTLLAVPTLVGSLLAAFLVSPRYLLVAGAKVVGKALDYSVFRAAKEMLYIPLSYAEQTRGKAIVDILTYRVAKGGASLIVAGLLALEAAHAATALTLGLVVGWLALSWKVTATNDAPPDG